MDSNPEFAPRMMPTDPRDIALEYIGGIFGDPPRRGGGGEEEGISGVTIIYTGGDDDYDNDIAIDDSMSASTVESGVLSFAGGGRMLPHENDGRIGGSCSVDIGEMEIDGGGLSDLNIFGGLGVTPTPQEDDLNIFGGLNVTPQEDDLNIFGGLGITNGGAVHVQDQKNYSMADSVIADPATREYIRTAAMNLIGRKFKELYPNIGKDAYYMWIYERLRVASSQGGVSDPIIPIVENPQSLPVTSVEPYWPKERIRGDTEMRAFLARNRMNALMPLVGAVSPPGIKMKIAEEFAKRSADTVKRKEAELEDTVRHAYQFFVNNLAKLRGADVDIYFDNDKVSIEPNSAIRIIREMPRSIEVGLIGSKLKQLEQRWGAINVDASGAKTRSFTRDIATLLMRYNNIMNTQTFEGVNLHAALPPPVFELLVSAMGVSAECFASPLNATLARFMSAFPDTDAQFGSMGSFFNYEFAEDGSYEANPPFTTVTIDRMITRIDEVLGAIAASDARSPTDRALSFTIIVPDWNMEAVDKIKSSPHKKWECVVKGGTHKYMAGQQHISDSTFDSTFDTYVAVVQSARGAERWKVPGDFEDSLKKAFGI